METPAYYDGYDAGRIDAGMNQRSEYAWFTEEAPGYTRDYSRGYRAGWYSRKRS